MEIWLKFIIYIHILMNILYNFLLIVFFTMQIVFRILTQIWLTNDFDIIFSFCIVIGKFSCFLHSISRIFISMIWQILKTHDDIHKYWWLGFYPIIWFWCINYIIYKPMFCFFHFLFKNNIFELKNLKYPPFFFSHWSHIKLIMDKF